MTSAGEPAILVVDDEPDVFAVTRMALRDLRYGGRRVSLLSAPSGKEGLRMLRERPDIAVVLLDVVMETSQAGLDAVRAIRGELGNHLVRILLRTGQPGAAPEREVIDRYDIDGYLAKSDLTATRLYSAVRTALKAYGELVALDRHQTALAFLHDAVGSLHAFEPLPAVLERVLQTALAIHPSPLGVLRLEALEATGAPREHLVRLGSGEPAEIAQGAADVAERLRRAPVGVGVTEREGGVVIPLRLHRELGEGWIWLKGALPDEVAARMLPILASHAANALYATVARANLEAREGPFFESINI